MFSELHFGCCDSEVLIVKCKAVSTNVLVAWDELTSIYHWVLKRSTFEQQHAVILGVLWELVVNTNADVKISAAVLSKALVRNCSIQFETTRFV